MFCFCDSVMKWKKEIGKFIGQNVPLLETNMQGGLGLLWTHYILHIKSSSHFTFHSSLVDVGLPNRFFTPFQAHIPMLASQTDFSPLGKAHTTMIWEEFQRSWDPKAGRCSHGPVSVEHSMVFFSVPSLVVRTTFCPVVVTSWGGSDKASNIGLIAGLVLRNSPKSPEMIQVGKLWNLWEGACFPIKLAWSSWRCRVICGLFGQSSRCSQHFYCAFPVFHSRAFARWIHLKRFEVWKNENPADIRRNSDE